MINQEGMQMFPEQRNWGPRVSDPSFFLTRLSILVVGCTVLTPAAPSVNHCHMHILIRDLIHVPESISNHILGISTFTVFWLCPNQQAQHYADASLLPDSSLFSLPGFVGGNSILPIAWDRNLKSTLPCLQAACPEHQKTPLYAQIWPLLTGIMTTWTRVIQVSNLNYATASLLVLLLPSMVHDSLLLTQQPEVSFKFKLMVSLNLVAPYITLTQS